MTVVIVIAVIVVVAVALGLMLRKRTGGNDGVDSFRRQIDALSPEARRPTVDQVKQVDRSPDDDETEGT